MIAPLPTFAPSNAVARDVPRRAHLIGIGGSGMSALAGVLLDRGWRLSGSDLELDATDWLAGRGVRLGAGHSASHVDPAAELVIYSDAVGPDNCERRQANRWGIEQRSYPQMLGQLMAERRGLAVAGTHGKSTTVAMLGAILSAAGLEPTVVGGGVPPGRRCGGLAGNGDWLVAEACEYRANFLHLAPHVGVLLGIELDHFDCFATPAQLQRAFEQFAAQVSPTGAIVANADCPAVARCLVSARARVVTFGRRQREAWTVRRVRHQWGRHAFELVRDGRPYCDVRLRVPGEHQVQNALAAAAAAAEAGATAADVARGLGDFVGISRRLEWVGVRQGVVWLDDYAHHPTAVSATLRAVRLMYPGCRLWCIFQPHQVSRTARLLDEFAASLQNADVVGVAEVFAVREPKSAATGATAAELARRARRLGGCVLPRNEIQAIFKLVTASARPGDVVVTLGAGNIRKRCDELADGV